MSDQHVNGNENFDPETGEVLGEGSEEIESNIQESLLEQVAREADSRAQRIRPLSMDRIKKIRETGEEIPIGIMGWVAKVSARANPKTGTLIAPGSRIVGQVVGVMQTSGKFGLQQAVIIFGLYECPKYLNRAQKIIPAQKKAGRWILGIDSSLSELPSCVGSVVSVEIERAADPGTGQRHTYKHVNVYRPNEAGNLAEA